MPRIHVPRDFVLNEGGKLRRIVAGIHEVDAATADHWWVRAHAIVEEAEPQADMAEDIKPRRRKG